MADETPAPAPYKLQEKKTVQEYQNLDAEDESLARWKASLGLGESLSDPNDPRTCIIKSLALEVAGRPDVTIDLSAPGALESLKEKPFTIKEGIRYFIKCSFVVQHELLSGLKYVQVVKRHGVPVYRHSEMLGSYAPSTAQKPVYHKKFEESEAPSGMLARGKFNVNSKFVDDDKNVHLEFDWTVDIKKDWE